jgi:SAM-dependent methyltransferase
MARAVRKQAEGKADAGLDADLRDSVERFDPEEVSDGLLAAEHKARYWWAAGVVEGKRVLDAGCGVGYGAQILADGGAQSVAGVDREKEAIELAQRSYADGRVEYGVADLARLSFESGTFDVVVCFEVIEHVVDRTAVLAELKRVLADKGLLIVSSPNRRVYLPGNPHHVHEYEPEELRKELSAFFEGVDLYRQHVWLGTAVLTDEEFESADDDREHRFPIHKLGSTRPGFETYTVAVAGDGDLPDLESLAALGEPFELRQWQERVDELEASDPELAGLRAYVAWIEQRHADAMRASSELHRALRDAHAQLLERDRQLAEALRDVRPLRSELEKAAAYARSLEDRIGALESQLQSRERELQAEIGKLTSTRVWRLANRYWTSRDRIRGLRTSRRPR